MLVETRDQVRFFHGILMKIERVELGETLAFKSAMGRGRAGGIEEPTRK